MRILSLSEYESKGPMLPGQADLEINKKSMPMLLGHADVEIIEFKTIVYEISQSGSSYR